jgi:lysyl-tRNA synthetase class 2
MSTAQTLREDRLKKLEKIREIGWNPYPSSYEKKQMIKETREMEGKEVKTAGKLFSFRTHGNIAFADLKDETGKIQLFFKKDVIGDENYKRLTLLDIGDYVGVEGTVTKTTAGELSIIPTSYTLLSKSLQQLPHEWFGLKDTEQRFRQRYLDLLLNPEVRERFNIRTKVLRYMREYLDDLGFWEVETPIFHPQYGGANAKPFMTHYNALGQDMYLRIAFELYLKRLISGGYERVYEIGRDFRNEGFDRSHSPEFTMIEWYEAYADYHRVMDVTEGLFKHLANKLNGSFKMKIDEKEIDLGGKWPRVTMSDIMKRELGLDVETATLDELLAYCTEHKIGLIGGETKGQVIFAIFEHSIPEKLIEPIWIIDYPEDVSPLSKNHRSKPGWVERFEGYIGGKEICDGWSELTDPIIQRQRFENDQKASRKDKAEAQQVDEDFITSMEFGMPPMGGIGIGIERLVMFFTNTWAIREVMLFPTLKAEKKVKPHVSLPTLKKNAPLTIDAEVKKVFPSIQVGVAVIKNISVKKEDEKLKALIKSVVEELQNMNPEALKDSKEILSYRKLYKEMGIDWHSRRPSPEALLRRVMQKKGLYTINTCVDAANVVVLNNKVSVGVFDLDKISSPTHLRFGKQGDSILLLGNEEATPIGEKELTYVDQVGPYNLDYNYRDTKRTAVSEETKNLLINVDGVHDIDRKLVESTLQDVVEIIRKYCGGEVELIGIVDENE